MKAENVTKAQDECHYGTNEICREVFNRKRANVDSAEMRAGGVKQESSSVQVSQFNGPVDERSNGEFGIHTLRNSRLLLVY